MASQKPSRSKRATRKRSGGGFSGRIFALASPQSIGGVSLFEPGVSPDAATVGDFEAEPDVVRRAVHLLADAGFDVLQATSFVTTLLPAMVASRLAHRIARRSYDEFRDLEPGRLNTPFERILDAERRLIERGVSLPVGGSLLIAARAR